MAMEKGLVVAPENLPFGSDTGMAHPKVKVEKGDSREETSATIQAGIPLGEQLKWSVSKWMKEEGELGLQQHSEGQRREYQKIMEPCLSKWKPSCLPQILEGKVKEQHLPHMKVVASSSWWPQCRKEDLPPQQTRDPNTSHGMEEELLIEASVSLEKQRQCFRHFCYSETEGPKGNCMQLWELCHQWLQPEKHSKEQILELVILEQFLAVLPWKMQNWVRGFWPGTCGQAVALAEDFLLREEEVKMQKEQVASPFVEVDGDVSRAVQTLCGAGQLCKEVKQEGEKEASPPGGHRLVSENRGRSPKMLNAVKNQCDELVENVESLQKEEETEVGCWSNRFTGSQREEFEEIKIQEQTCREKERNPCYKPIISHPRPADTFRLPNCGESFDYEESKQIVHAETHAEKPYRRLLGGESFSQSSHRTSHQPCHAGEKPYWDSDIGQSFSLLAHQRSHAGESVCKNSSGEETLRPKRARFRKQPTAKNSHCCAECGKSFCYQSHLTRHQRVHTGEKPYQCSECRKSFSQRQHFLDHLKLHTGENLYQCLACGKSFLYMSQFVIHQRSHTGEKPYPCPVCGRGFSQRTHLLRHQKIHGDGEKCPC